VQLKCLGSCGRRHDAAVHAAAGGAAAAGESRAADGLLEGALGGGRDDEEWE